tara:strand:+ start:410 stop:853 length:444 start_codon:yes stop_codon:yes gene_type:complete
MSVKITNKRPPSVTKVGRKPAISKLTPEMVETACEAFELGMSQTRVARLLQIPESTFSKLLKRDEEAVQTLLSAKEKGVKKHLANIARHSEKQWLASAWWLDRTQLGEFSQKTNRTGDSSAGSVLIQLVKNVTGKAKESTKQSTIDV